MNRSVLALIAGVGASMSAQAAFISFGSDSNPAAPTFVASYDSGTLTTTLSNAPGATVDLLIDANESGPGAPITIAASFTANIDLSYAGSVQIFPGFFSHTFSATGSFEFRDSITNVLLFRGDIGASEGGFAAMGSGTTMFSGSMSGFGIDYTIGPDGMSAVGFGGVVLGDFGFTLTAISGGSASLAFDGNNIAGINDFESEGSFSGSFVPAPGAAALMGLAGLAGLRRRR
jgi:MYXO-CTERM domain-containing protein